MNPEQVILAIRDESISLISMGPQGWSASSLAIEHSESPEEWCDALSRVAPRLGELVLREGLGGHSTSVVYRSPTESIHCQSFPGHSATQAVDAALLACPELLAFPASHAVMAGHCIASDRDGDPRRHHVLTAADEERTAAAIDNLVGQAGLTHRSATPLLAILQAQFYERALGTMDSETAHIYFGEYASYIVITCRGSLLFQRRVEIGIDTLARSMTRPIRLVDAEEPITLDLSRARRVLQRHGIPPRDLAVEPQHALTGLQLVPMMQPVLQRFVTEVRQSIRFGLTEEQRARLTIEFSGPGAALDGLCDLVANDIDYPVTLASPGAPEDGVRDDPTLNDFLSSARDRRRTAAFNLLPRAVAEARRCGRLRRWLWAGGIAATIAVGIEAGRYHFALEQARRQAAATSSQYADYEVLNRTLQQLRSVLVASSDLQHIVATELAYRPSYEACLMELTRLTPDSIRYTSIVFSQDNGRTLATVAGYGIASGESSDRPSLEAFVQGLEASPLFAHVTLGSVSLGDIYNTQGTRFEITMTAIDTPREELLPATLVSAGEGVSE